jgi:hypothetical protein
MKSKTSITYDDKNNKKLLLAVIIGMALIFSTTINVTPKVAA